MGSGKRKDRKVRLPAWTAALLVLICLSGSALGETAEPEIPGGYRDRFQDLICFCLMEELEIGRAPACGIAANMVHESGLRTTALGDNGTSFGLCQWHMERWQRLSELAEGIGLPMEDISAQLLYLRQELNGRYRDVLEELRSVPETASGAAFAAALFCREFEKPAGGEETATRRGDTAERIYLTDPGPLPAGTAVMKILYMLSMYRDTAYIPVSPVPGESVSPWDAPEPPAPEGGPLMTYDLQYWDSLDADREGETLFPAAPSEETEDMPDAGPADNETE